MTFQFESWQAFWEMGGYGFFVWLAFGVSLLAVLASVYESIWAKQQLIKAVNAQIARKQRIKQANSKSTATTAAASNSDKSLQEAE